MNERIGLTGGGDCPGLNSIRARQPPQRSQTSVSVTALRLLEPLRYQHLDYKQMDAQAGGTILGTTNKAACRQDRPWPSQEHPRRNPGAGETEL